MEPVLKPSLAESFRTAMSRGRAVLFSAPCGFGKTTTARALLAGRRVHGIAGGERVFVPPGAKWDVLLVDNLQRVNLTADQEELCRLLRESSDKQFVFLSRGVAPAWLLPFQAAGLLTVLGPRDLAFDLDATARLLEQYGVSPSNPDLRSIQKVTRGCPLPLVLLAQHLQRGEPYNEVTTDRVRRELFFYYEERVLHQMDPDMQRLLLELAPFEPIEPELARIVSGNSRAGELLGRFQRESVALIQERLDRYHFWPIFRRFLLWELEQAYSADQRKALYNRGGLYYELQEDYGRALACYAESGDHAKISELLEKNGQMHPGMGHYEEMEPYYRALPEEELKASPALMQGMSMLCAMRMDFQESERWYGELKALCRRRRRQDAVRREARGRIVWLDLALPQRQTEGMIDVFTSAFRLLRDREIRLPPFSVTSALPSLMNGGKDFSPWSRKDDLLYATLRLPVEAVLGRDGVCMADCAIAESKFEKGENIKDRALALLSNLERIRRDGTPDIEFAAVGLLVRTQVDAGRPQDARQTLENLRERFAAQREDRFLPNLEAMLCRVDLYLGDDEAVSRWYRERAPRDPQTVHVLKRYQYLTQAMAELSMGRDQAALVTLAPLEEYFTVCRRYLDGIHLHILRAIACRRLREGDWRASLCAALDTAASFRFIRPVSQYGGAVLPLLLECGWKGDGAYWEQLLSAVREQASIYPDYLQPLREPAAPLSPTEQQVLRLLCAGKSNAEIGAVLGIKTATVKVHVNHIFGKLGVRHREEAREAARRLHLIWNEGGAR